MLFFDKYKIDDMADSDFVPAPQVAQQYYAQPMAPSAQPMMQQPSFLRQKLAGLLTTRNIIILIIVVVVIYLLYRQMKSVSSGSAAGKKSESDVESQAPAADADALIDKLEKSGAIV